MSKNLVDTYIEFMTQKFGKDKDLETMKHLHMQFLGLLDKQFGEEVRKAFANEIEEAWVKTKLKRADLEGTMENLIIEDENKK